MHNLFGSDFNLAAWQIFVSLTNLNDAILILYLLHFLAASPSCSFLAN